MFQVTPPYLRFLVYSTSIIGNNGRFLIEQSYAAQCTVFCRFLDENTATSNITKAPVSKTALVGTNTQFHCAGTGTHLVWEVDGLTPDHQDILARMITVVTLSSSGTVQSNLTVPATSVNNGTTVRCAIGVSYASLTFSNYSTLTVLPGEV